MNLSHSKGSIIVLRIFSPLLFPSFEEDDLLVYFLFFLSKHQLLSTSRERHSEALLHSDSQDSETFQITWISLHQHHLCLPACANLQFNSPHCAAFFFSPKKNRRFLLRYLVGNSKKRGTATVSHRQRVRNPTSHRISVFSSSDRKEKKLHTSAHMAFSLAFSSASSQTADIFIPFFKKKNNNKKIPKS